MTVTCSNSCLTSSRNKPTLEDKLYGKTYKKSSIINPKDQLLKILSLPVQNQLSLQCTVTFILNQQRHLLAEE